VLFVPQNQPGESFNKYGSKTDNIKVKSCAKLVEGWQVTVTCNHKVFVRVVFKVGILSCVRTV
jgi:hypothetical protein